MQSARLLSLRASLALASLLLAAGGGACGPARPDVPARYTPLQLVDESAELLRLGGEARRAIELSAGTSQRWTLSGSGADELLFALARPEQALPPAVDLVVDIAHLAADGSQRTTSVRLPVGAPPTWFDRRVSLESQDVAVELSLSGAREGERIWVGEMAERARGRRGARLLVITSDTHRADHLGAQPGSVDVATPTLDALAARGVLLSDCLATTNITNPSHISIFTGTHPRDHGIDDNRHALASAAQTLAESARAQGVRTLAVVSAQHLGDTESGLGQGFERMSWPVDDSERAAPVSLRRARRWLDELDDEPALLWVHLFDAHRPYRAPAHWRDAYWEPGRDPTAASIALEVPPEVLPEKYSDVRDLDYLRSLYRSEVSFLDEELRALLEHPALSDAVTALTADHGESLGEHGIHFGHAGLYPQTIHVPLLLSWPGGPQGLRYEEPVDHLDLGATLLDLGGWESGGLPGRSLRPQLEGVSARAAQPRFALAGHGFSASLTHAGWQLVLQLKREQQPNMSIAFERHATQLFDLSADPGCRDDLAAAQPARTAEMRARLTQWLGAARGLPWARSVADDEQRDERLAALGYLASDPAEGEPLWVSDDCDHCRRWNSPR